MGKRKRAASRRALKRANERLRIKKSFPRGQCLKTLEREVWPEPTFRSYLVTTCHRLQKKSICCFTVEDLRIMIGQDIGLRYLMPIAIERLEEDPLAEGDFYPGDLFANVLRVRPDFWVVNPDMVPVIESILARLHPIPDELEPAVAEFRANSSRGSGHGDG
jgi:hypothetical protein